MANLLKYLLFGSNFVIFVSILFVNFNVKLLTTFRLKHRIGVMPMPLEGGTNSIEFYSFLTCDNVVIKFFDH